MNKETSVKSKSIGVIGLGKMGGLIAKRYLKKDFSVYVYDINKKAMELLINQGAIGCSSPKEIALKSDFVFEVTPNDKTSREVWLGRRGVLSGASPQKILAVCATVSAGWIDELASICKASGFHFFDMGLTGGNKKDTSAHCGGDKKLLQQIKPVLRVFAGKVIYFGPAGHGMRFKLILNYLQVVQLISFGQAVKIARAENMDVEKVLFALSEKISGIAYNFILSDFNYKEKEPLFTVELITKDLTYVKQLAAKLNIHLLDEILITYKKTLEKGYAKDDWYNVNVLE